MTLDRTRFKIDARPHGLYPDERRLYECPGQPRRGQCWVVALAPALRNCG